MEEGILSRDEKENYAKNYILEIKEAFKRGKPYTSSTDVCLRIVNGTGIDIKDAQDIVALIAGNRKELEDIGYDIGKKGYFYLPQSLIEEARKSN